MKAAPIRADFTTPIATPPADCAMRATASGNTGATQSTCRKRSAPYTHTLRTGASAATNSDERTSRAGISRRSGTSSASRDASTEPSAAAADKRKGRRSAGDAEHDAAEEQLDQRPRGRRAEEGEPLRHLHDRIERLRVAALGPTSPHRRRDDRRERRDAHDPAGPRQRG